MRECGPTRKVEMDGVLRRKLVGAHCMCPRCHPQGGNERGGMTRHARHPEELATKDLFLRKINSGVLS